MLSRRRRGGGSQTCASAAGHAYAGAPRLRRNATGGPVREAPGLLRVGTASRTRMRQSPCIASAPIASGQPQSVTRSRLLESTSFAGTTRKPCQGFGDPKTAPTQGLSSFVLAEVPRAGLSGSPSCAARRAEAMRAAAAPERSEVGALPGAPSRCAGEGRTLPVGQRNEVRSAGPRLLVCAHQGLSGEGRRPLVPVIKDRVQVASW